MTAIVATKREQFGSKASQADRAAGRVPTTISVAGADSLHVSLVEKDAEALVAGPQTTTLSLDGSEYTVLIKSYDRHPINDQIQHIDLQGITDESVVKVEVPLAPDVSNCPGIVAGGMLEMMRRSVMVKCAARDLPSQLRVPLDTVQVTDTVYAGDVELPAGVKLLTKPRVAVLSILLTRGMRKAQQESKSE